MDGITIREEKKKKEQQQDKKTGIVEEQRTTPKKGKVLVKNHTIPQLPPKCRDKKDPTPNLRLRCYV